MRRYLPFAAFLLACSASAADRRDSSSTQPRAAAASSRPAADTARGALAADTARTRQTAATSATPARNAPADLPIVRALYVNRFAAQSSKRMRKLIAIADSTEINALV